MKKISLLFLSSFLAVASFSQVTIGLRVSPAISMNRVKDLDNADNVSYSNNGSGLRLAVGPTIDFKIGENYAFSTGAWYLSSRAGLSKTDERFFGFASSKDVVSLQSVQIPLTFKVYTNEFATNMKLYFQLGGLATFNFYEKHKETTPALLMTDYKNKYNVFDFALYMGAGVSYKIGESNALFAGFYYNRGLLNVLSGKAEPISSKKYNQGARYNMDLAGIEVGITF